MTLRFLTLKTFIDPMFWTELSRRKLDVWKLDEKRQTAFASYSNFDSESAVSRLSLSFDAFEGAQSRSNLIKVEGSILVLNTIETFKNINRKELINDAAEELKERIISRRWLSNPLCLNTFIFTVYADFKKFKFFFWNCIPALLSPRNIKFLSPPALLPVEISDIISKYFQQNDNRPFLLINREPQHMDGLCSVCVTEAMDLFVVYPDSSTRKDVPGWPMRNLLAAFAYTRKDLTSVRFICYRSGSIPSTVMHIGWEAVGNILGTEVSGWERDKEGDLKPSVADLSSTLDPLRMLEKSVELNLRLMRWRLVPDMVLERFTNVRCLILGAGTLGCNVSRALIGWGIRHITFVDSGCVSYSNVIRQSLFEYRDTVDGGKPKAHAAAEALLRIHPLLNVKGVHMKIPMPGHTVSSEDDTVRSAADQFAELVKDHDVLFLVLDSREARWLPTLLAAYHRKLAISVALGFDSFLVIRHGVLNDESSGERQIVEEDKKLIAGSQLSCYFCSDVTAPGNSTRDRTMDQQCTVSRPGISSAAAGTAVELLAALIQSPLGGATPAQLEETDENTTILGATPHQIRSFFSRFSQLTLAVRRFESCVACGSSVRNAYEAEGYDFLYKVFNDSKCLETVSGLAQLQESATAMSLWDFDDDESVSSLS